MYWLNWSSALTDKFGLSPVTVFWQVCYWNQTTAFSFTSERRIWFFFSVAIIANWNALQIWHFFGKWTMNFLIFVAKKFTALTMSTTNIITLTKKDQLQRCSALMHGNVLCKTLIYTVHVMLLLIIEWSLSLHAIIDDLMIPSTALLLRTDRILIYFNYVYLAPATHW